MVTCPFCLEEVEKLHKKSHIVPEWMYRDCYDPNHKALGVYLKSNNIEKRQSGFYAEFLCEDCEKIFQEDDRYSSIIFGERSPESPELNAVTKKTKQQEIYTYSTWEGFDFKKLQKFVYGVLIRGCLHRIVTKGNELILNKHYKNLENIYRDDTNLDDETYPVLINKIDDNSIVYPPFKGPRIDGHYTIKFVGAGFEFLIFISSHKPSVDYVEQMKLSNSNKLILLHLLYTETGTFGDSIEGFQNIHKQKGEIINNLFKDSD